MPKTQTDPSGVLPFPKELPPLPDNGTELYDSIMQMVEPELVSKELPKVRERLKAEKPEAVKAHARRYMEAFSKFNQIMKQSEKAMHRGIKQFVHTAYASLEQTTNAMDAEKITQLEETFAEQKAVKQKTPEEIMKEVDKAPDPNIK